MAGIKISRVVWLAKSVARWTPGGTELDEEQTYLWDGDDVEFGDARVRVFGAAAIATTWFATLATGTIFLVSFNPLETFSACLFESISARSGVGLSSGLTDNTLDTGSKIVLSLMMILGRVEITAIVILVTQPIHESLTGNRR